MTKDNLILDKVISRLKFFNYRYEVQDKTLKVFLPMWCYLKLKFSDDKIKMTSHIRFGLPFLQIEYVFYIYAIALYFLTSFYWTAVPNKGIFLLFGLFIILLVVCFIKIESLRTIVHQWIEQEKLLKESN